MTKFLKLTIITFLMTIAASCGQQKRYITYKIKKGEKMRDVAKRFDMKTRDLMKINPGISRRPKPGTKIIVPESKQDATANNKKNTTKKVISIKKTVVNTLKHTVLPKETVYAITKKFEISKEALITWNPQYPGLKKNILKVGQILKVGEKKETSVDYISDFKDDEDSEIKEFATHEVISGDTVFSIIQKYGSTKDELIKLNPKSLGLKNELLTIGETITVRINKREEQGESIDYIDQINIEKPIKIALLLPFQAEALAQDETKNIFKKRIPNLVTDFYLGAEMAIDSIRKQGITLSVEVYDTGKKGKNTQKIISSNKFQDVDAIIGPFFVKQADLVAQNTKATVLFPHFSNKQENFTSRNLIKTSPNVNNYINTLTNFLKKQYKQHTIFVVGDGKQSSDNQVFKLVNNLQKIESINTDNIVVLKPEKGYIDKRRFTDKIKENSKVWVISTCDDTAAVADMLNSFIVLPENVTAQLFAVKKGKAYNNIDNNKLAKLSFTYVSESFLDHSKSKVKKFITKYKRKNNIKPSNYATKGFDLTYDVLARLSSGKKLRRTYKEGKSSRIANKYDVKKTFFGSSENKGLYIIKYKPNLTLKEVKQ